MLIEVRCCHQSAIKRFTVNCRITPHPNNSPWGVIWCLQLLTPHGELFGASEFEILWGGELFGASELDVTDERGNELDLPLLIWMDVIAKDWALK